MPSVYTDFDPAKPDASTQAGSAFGASANANDVALWYGVIMGAMKGFVFSIVGTSGSYTVEQPNYFVWTNGAVRVRATNTWGTSGGETGNITQQVWEVSQDSGSTPNSTGTWAAVATETYTYDATSGAVTATTAAGGMLAPLMYLLGRFKVLASAYVAHAAATGASVHGLGTLSTQNAGAVAITGGSIAGTSIGIASPAAVVASLYQGVCINLGNSITGSVAVDWSAGDYFYGTFTGAGAALTFSNLPAADRVQGITIEITNAAIATSPWPTVNWPAGTAPSRSSGIDIYEFMCRDGTNVRGAQAHRNSS